MGVDAQMGEGNGRSLIHAPWIICSGVPVGRPKTAAKDVSMITLDLAQKLKEAGLIWHTSVHDFFAIPDRDLDSRIFVLSDMMVTMDILRGWPAVVFHGTSEWALDYLLTHEAVWLPTESQLREQVEAELAARNGRFLQLARAANGYNCELTLANQPLNFAAKSASEAYGQALLHLLKQQMPQA